MTKELEASLKKKKPKAKKNPYVVDHACNFSIWEVQAGESKVQDQPQLHSKFKANLKINKQVKWQSSCKTPQILNAQAWERVAEETHCV